MLFPYFNMIAIPGEALAAEEECMPSSGTYLENGTIYSMLIGMPKTEDMKVCIERKMNDAVTFKEGMYVLGEIVENMRTVIFVKISDYRLGSTKYIALKSGKIIAQKGGREHFGIGDIILAYIYRSEKDSYILELKGPELGVVYSLCNSCNGFMKQIDAYTLKCNECHSLTSTKVSRLYGNAKAIEEFLANSNSGKNGDFYSRRYR
ncbi:MAG: exosome complex RNA-binding protein Csl4 [Candidatus Micrarchaeaceae archaeon]